MENVMENELRKVSGELVLDKIKKWNYTYYENRKELLDYADVRNKNYVDIYLPLDLLRKQDPNLDKWLSNPPEIDSVHRTAKSPVYSPILIGNRFLAGLSLKDQVVDGYYRVLMAQRAGQDRVRAFVPEDSPLIDKAIRQLETERLSAGRQQVADKRFKGYHP
ncbi:hypothetical protein [Olivibacter jilunii]|uniref:hypothetical protein n=1 Tax=Olivibacter jilunii TaxID=985016 RepID=UPI00102FDF7A|nr:hypothetical protein [Olivibacter jilunii]